MVGNQHHHNMSKQRLAARMRRQVLSLCGVMRRAGQDAAVLMCLVLILLQYGGVVRQMHLALSHSGHEPVVSALEHGVADEGGHSCALPEGGEAKHVCNICEQLKALRTKVLHGEIGDLAISDEVVVLEIAVVENDEVGYWRSRLGRGPPLV